MSIIYEFNIINNLYLKKNDNIYYPTNSKQLSNTKL